MAHQRKEYIKALPSFKPSYIENSIHQATEQIEFNAVKEVKENARVIEERVREEYEKRLRQMTEIFEDEYSHKISVSDLYTRIEENQNRLTDRKKLLVSAHDDPKAPAYFLTMVDNEVKDLTMKLKNDKEWLVRLNNEKIKKEEDNK